MSTKYVSARRTFGPPSNPRQAPHFSTAVNKAASYNIPAIVSGFGGMASVVIDKETGIYFDPGSSSSLADKIEWAFGHLAEMNTMGNAARTDFEEKYSAEENCDQLMTVVKSVV